MKNRLNVQLGSAALNSGDMSELRAIIDRLDPALVVTERDARTSAFRVLCANSAFESATGLDRGEIEGRPVDDILPGDQAVQLLYRLRKAAGQGEVLQCTELLGVPAGELVRETTFIPFTRPDGTQRVIWAGVTLQHIARRLDEQLMFDDLRYFSTDAARQLAQVTQFLDAIGETGETPRSLRPAAQTLAAICRSADRSLEEISVRSTRLSEFAEAPAAFLVNERRFRGDEGYLAAMRAVVQDLITLVATDSHEPGDDRSPSQRPNGQTA